MEMRDSNGTNSLGGSGKESITSKASISRSATSAAAVAPGEGGNRDTESSQMAPSIRQTVTTRADLMHIEFYSKPGWVEEAAEVLFKIRARNTTIRSECFFGLIHFISCVFVLAVIPQQLSNAGYNARSTVVATAATCGLGCVICGLFANLPFILAPPAVIAIFLTNNLQTNSLSPAIGSSAVFISGIVLSLLGYRPLALLVSKLIPLPIQVPPTPIPPYPLPLSPPSLTGRHSSRSRFTDSICRRNGYQVSGKGCKQPSSGAGKYHARSDDCCLRHRDHHSSDYI